MKRAARLSLVAVVGLAGAAYGFREATKARCWSWGAPTICRVETDRKLVALTFDDGPSALGVEHVLRVLEGRDAKATFFLIGSDVEKRPGLAKRLSAAGHEIGNHSFSHRHLVDLRGASIADEIARTDAALRAQGVTPSRWFRPPYGQKFVGLGKAAEQRGKTIAMWNVEEPGASDGAKAYADRMLADVHPGSVILIHPMTRSRNVERAALPIILDGLEAKGFRAVTLSDLVASGRGPL